MLQFRARLDEHIDELLQIKERVVRDDNINDVEIIDKAMNLYALFRQKKNFIDPTAVSLARQVVTECESIALCLELRELKIWKDFVSLLTHDMWSLRSFALFIVCSLGITTTEQDDENETLQPGETFQNILQSCARKIGIQDETETKGAVYPLLKKLLKFANQRCAVDAYDSDLCDKNEAGLNREGLRIVERAWMLNLAMRETVRSMQNFTKAEIEPTVTLALSDERLKAWTEKCVKGQLGNEILGKLDQWSTTFAIRPLSIYLAGGERGGCPADQKSDIPNHVARCTKNTKLSLDEIPQAQFIFCFSVVCQQRFGFDWMRLCFVPIANPMQRLKILNLYTHGPDLKPPPIVVQTERQRYQIIIKNPNILVEAHNGFAAIRTWCELTKKFRDGYFSRKKNIAELIERILQ